MAEHKFIVTIRADHDLDASDVQQAVVDAARPGDEVYHGNTDVELAEVDHYAAGTRGDYSVLRYKVLDVA